MKRTKRTLSLLIALAMVLLSATTAFAAVPGAGEPVQVFPSPEELALLNESNLISAETIHYFVDEDGDVVDVVVGDVPTPYANSQDFRGAHYVANLYFYKVNETYCVSLTATSNSGYGFTKFVFKIRPKNGTQWMIHTTPCETRPTSISDVMAFTYPNGAPSNVTVEAKVDFTLRGDDFLELDTPWPFNSPYVLDNPGNA